MRGALEPRRSLETRGVPCSGAGRFHNGTFWGVALVARSGSGELLTKPTILHRVKIIGSLGKELQQAIMQAVVSYSFTISSPLFSFLPSRTSYSGSQQALLPLPHYVLWVELRQQLLEAKETFMPPCTLSTIVALPVHIYGWIRLPCSYQSRLKLPLVL